MKIINAYPGSLNEPMTEEETKNFMTNKVLAYYLDGISNKIYINTLKTTKG